MKQTAVEWLMANLKYALGGNQAVKGQAVLTIDDLNDFEQEALEREQKHHELIYKRGYADGAGETQLVNSIINNKQ